MLEGWLLNKIKSGSSKESNDIRKNICYMYLNRRPIDLIPKIMNTLDAYYKKYNRLTKYAYIINIVLPNESFDVNLTPNKREIFIKEQLINMIISELNEFVEKNIVEDIPMYQDYEEKKISNYFKTSQIPENNKIALQEEESSKLQLNGN
jgi:DNA mismatch repair ATPase MutL